MSTSRRLVTAFLIGAFVSGASAKAQVPMFLGNWNAGIGGGASIPTGSMSNVYYAGWTLNAWVAYHGVGSSISGRAMYSFQRFTASLPSTPAINTNGFSGELVGHLPAIYAHPYLLAGVGGYHLSDIGTRFGWHAGAGVAFHIISRTTLLEAKYLAMGNNFHTVPITVGIVF
jgi:hypothetical protein